MYDRSYGPMYGPMHPYFGGFIFFFAAVGLVIAIAYVLTLRKALLRCAAQNRASDPDAAWLLFIPLFNLFWQFIFYPRISTSLEREFRQRGLPIEPNPARSLGLALAILQACSIVPILNIFTGLAALVLFILYWIRIAAYSRRLQEASYAGATIAGSQPQWPGQTSPAPPIQPSGSSQFPSSQPQPTRFCSTCGSPLREGERFCPNCGTPAP